VSLKIGRKASLVNDNPQVNGRGRGRESVFEEWKKGLIGEREPTGQRKKREKEGKDEDEKGRRRREEVSLKNGRKDSVIHESAQVNGGEGEKK
jgi:hypothetical protein